MADTQSTEVDPMLSAAKQNLLGPDLGRVVCMTHPTTRRVREGLEDFADDCGSAPRIGAWKGRRSS